MASEIEICHRIIYRSLVQCFCGECDYTCTACQILFAISCSFMDPGVIANEKSLLINQPEDSVTQDTTGHASIQGTVVNLASTAIGAGTLTLPYAFACTGWAAGLGLLIITWGCSIFGMLLLTMSSFRVSILSGEFSYRLVSVRAGGLSLAMIVQICVAFYTAGTCIAYTVFLGQFIPETMLSFLPPSNILCNRVFVVCVAATAFLFPISLFRNLSALRFTRLHWDTTVSFMAIVLVLYSVVAVAVRFFQQPTIDPSVVPMNVSLGLFKGFPMMVVAFTAHYNILRLYEELHHRSTHRMAKASFAATCFCCVVYAAMSILGYLAWGTSMQDDILDMYPPNDWLMLVARIGFSFVIIFHYPLIHHALRRVVDSLLFPSAKNGSYLRLVLLSAALVFACTLVAVLVPSVSTILGYNGSTFGVCITYVFPPLFFLKLSSRSHMVISGIERNGALDPRIVAAFRALSVAVLFIGVIFGCLGVATTTWNILYPSNSTQVYL